MEIRVNYDGYNSRRFSRPWISKVVSWPEGGKPVVGWGSYVGDDNGGYVAISAVDGDIIRHGQKDNRQPKNNTYDWFVAREGGCLEQIQVQGARNIFLKKNGGQV